MASLVVMDDLIFVAGKGAGDLTSDQHASVLKTRRKAVI